MRSFPQFHPSYIRKLNRKINAYTTYFKYIQFKLFLYLIWGKNDRNKLPPSDIKLNLPVDTQSCGDGGFFKACSPPASIQRTALTLRTFTCSQSSLTDIQRDGDKPGDGKLTATVATQNNITWKSKEIRAISLSSCFYRSGVHTGSLGMRSDPCHAEEE